VTFPLNVKLASTAPEMGEGDEVSVVLVPIKLGVDQLLSKFVTFTEPSPVAKS
jgi:hypothetical protein